MDRNYYPYFVLPNGEEWTDKTSYEFHVAYDEAMRHKTERNTIEAGVKVFTKGCFKIINWNEGKKWRGDGTYLYKIII